MHRYAGEWRHGGAIALLPFQKGCNGGGGAFSQQHHRYFYGLLRSTWNKFIAAIRAPRQFRMIFCNFCYYFWGRHWWWTETNIIGNDFFVFYKFPLPSAFLLLSLPYRCSGVPEYACCVNKLRQNVGLQTWLWCHIVCERERESLLAQTLNKFMQK